MKLSLLVAVMILQVIPTDCQRVLKRRPRGELPRVRTYGGELPQVRKHVFPPPPPIASPSKLHLHASLTPKRVAKRDLLRLSVPPPPPGSRLGTNPTETITTDPKCPLAYSAVSIVHVYDLTKKDHASQVAYLVSCVKLQIPSLKDVCQETLNEFVALEGQSTWTAGSSDGNTLAACLVNLIHKYIQGHFADFLTAAKSQAAIEATTVGQLVGNCVYAHTGVCTSPYRSYDGSCNNVANPWWGKARTPFRRNTPSDYGDGASTMRRAKDGDELPSAREVLLKVNNRFKEELPHSNTLTHLAAFCSQLVSHDVALSQGFMTTVNGMELEPGCGMGGCKDEDQDTTMAHAFCKPIKLVNDPFYPSSKQCIKFVRLQAAEADCDGNATEQTKRGHINVISHYLDASFVYGSSEDQAEDLRDLTDTTRGKMIVQDNPYCLESMHEGMMPTKTDSRCPMHNTHTKCFRCGDNRCAAHINLSALHTIFVRFHNHVEEKLHNMWSTTTGEIKFQEARKIVIAVWQHIVYNEFLPIVLGPSVTDAYSLTSTEGVFNGYNASLDAKVSYAYNYAALRFGHSMLTDQYQRTDVFGHSRLSHMNTMTFDPLHMYEPVTGGPDAIMRGQIYQPTDRVDSFFSDFVSTELVGIDLPSVNVQRGRDVALSGYMEHRRNFELGDVDTWEHLIQILVPNSTVNGLEDVYTDVDDIDLYVGGLLEAPATGAIVGPTFCQILAEQHKRLKYGDRFWYEKPDQFTSTQLAEIKKMTFSRLICDSTTDTGLIAPYSMVMPNIHQTGVLTEDLDMLVEKFGSNIPVECSAIPDMLYSEWTVPP